jgi:two-component system, NtrC family, sensor kinase
MKRQTSLRRTVSIWLFVVLAAAMVPFMLLVVKNARDDLEAATARHVVQIAEMVVKSTRLAMLLDEGEAVTQIIADISKQPGIERLRLLNSEGQVIDSKHTKDVGFTVDKKEHPCLHCHQGNQPLEHVPIDKRWRIVEDTPGQRMLIAMEVIRNEPTCSSASCHEHRPDQKVLGVVDITYSLADIDRSINQHAASILGAWLGFVALFALGAGWLLQRKVYRPLRDLESGAAKISRGELEHEVPVRGSDEFARLASSFNAMRTALKQSRQGATDLIQTLESRVEERSKELSAARAEAAHSETLASIGMLASGIAHELNNPLTGVLTFTTLLRRKAQPGSQDAEDLDLVIGETRRCASIIKRLLDFAREKVPVKGPFDLNQLVRETVAFVERSASLRQVEIATALDPALPQAWGDGDLIKQVVLNILVNAEQAITGAGRVEVSTRLLPATATAAPQLEIAVRDTGCGIPAANLSHIFDPFFTTKEVGKGTGLGLSVSYGIVKSHGGAITVDSVEGVGSTFHILLPLHAAPPATDTEPTENEPTEPAHERKNPGH